MRTCPCIAPRGCSPSRSPGARSALPAVAAASCSASGLLVLYRLLQRLVVLLAWLVGRTVGSQGRGVCPAMPPATTKGSGPDAHCAHLHGMIYRLFQLSRVLYAVQSYYLYCTPVSAQYSYSHCCHIRLALLSPPLQQQVQVQ